MAHLELVVHGAGEVKVHVRFHVLPPIGLRHENIFATGRQCHAAHLPNTRHPRCESLTEDIFYAPFPCTKFHGHKWNTIPSMFQA